MIIEEVDSPARLNVLLGAIQVTVTAAAFSETDASGTCFIPGNNRSE